MRPRPLVVCFLVSCIARLDLRAPATLCTHSARSDQMNDAKENLLSRIVDSFRVQ